MVEEPIQAGQRNVRVDLLEDVQSPADGLVIGGVHSPGPAVLGQHPHDLFEFTFHRGGHVRARLAEILEVGGRIDQHLAGPVMPEVVVPLLVRRGLGPVQEVVLLRLRFLGKEVVGEANGQLAIIGELLDDRIVLRIALGSAAGVDDAGHAQPVQLAHEMAGRVELILEGKLGPLAQGRVEDPRVRLGQQHARGLSIGVADDLAARGLGRVSGVADGSQRRGVQQRTVVQVEQEDGCFRGGRIELLDGRQPPFGKLLFAEAADDADPLRRGRDRHLPLEHRHGVRERAHAVPAQLHVVVQATADDVGMIVDEARKRGTSHEVDDLGLGPGQRYDVRVQADVGEPSVGDRDRACVGIGAVQRREPSPVQDDVRGLGRRRGSDVVRHCGLHA